MKPSFILLLGTTFLASTGPALGVTTITFHDGSSNWNLQSMSQNPDGTYSAMPPFPPAGGATWAGTCWDMTTTETYVFKTSFLDVDIPGFVDKNVWWLSLPGMSSAATGFITPDIVWALTFDDNSGPGGIPQLDIGASNTEAAGSPNNQVVSPVDLSSLYNPAVWHDLEFSITGDGTGNYTIGTKISVQSTGMVLHDDQNFATFTNISLFNQGTVCPFWCAKFENGGGAFGPVRIPEPSMAGLLLLGAVAASSRRRRHFSATWGSGDLRSRRS